MGSTAVDVQISSLLWNVERNLVMGLNTLSTFITKYAIIHSWLQQLLLLPFCTFLKGRMTFSFELNGNKILEKIKRLAFIDRLDDTHTALQLCAYVEAATYCVSLQARRQKIEEVVPSPGKGCYAKKG